MTLQLEHGSCAIVQRTEIEEVCNSSPTAKISVSQQVSHPSGFNIVRISSSSTDPDGDSLSYRWEIDGVNKGTSSGVNMQTIDAQTISVKLTVTDNGPYSLKHTTTSSVYIRPWKNSGSNY